MKIELKEVTIKDLTEGYSDKAEAGVVALAGKLDVRPAYQREFIYKEKQRDAVINTIVKGFPLNVMYWAVCASGTYELIDGQQRTISICQYINGEFSFNSKYIHNLKADQKQQILDYKLMIYICSGTDSERLEWFKTINIASEKLTNQELRNAVYSGSWVSDAKKYFSKNNCVAYNIGSDYLHGTPIRQDYLETAIKWISNNKIEDYMGLHQNDPNALELWSYFQSVMTWIGGVFVTKRKHMKGVEWGVLYNQFKEKKLDHNKIEQEVSKLICDDDVTDKSGIYAYVLTRKEKYLSIRAFTDSMKQKVYEKQQGICVLCQNRFEISQMEADHITPWNEGGKTNEDNCQMLCKEDNRRKSGK
ncbi:MAG: DUF262 domain-containing protein [Alphaproteobacteria bacterium]|jgi:hypothetical protein|nr:DUF262 domain-containing protein [Alphaproteobacteria bacterium]